MRDTAQKTPRTSATRRQIDRIRLMSEDERRRKAAEILATGLLKLVHASASDDKAEEEVDHVQG